MVYDFQQIRKNVNEGRRPYHFGGPWLAEPWGSKSWKHWKRFSSITVEWEETYSQSDIAESGPDFEEGPRSRTEYRREKTFLYTATIGPEDIYRGASGVIPSDKSAWLHGSRTAYGSGLYDASGQIIIRGQAHETDKLTLIFTPAGGAPVNTVVTNTTDDYDSVIDMEYATDPELPINGMGTFCRMTLGQVFHGPTNAPFPPSAPFPPELDPDGNPGTEVYFTDAALAELAGGAFTGEMVQTGGTISQERGPNAGGFDNGDFDEFSYTRSGSVTITFA